MRTVTLAGFRAGLSIDDKPDMADFDPVTAADRDAEALIRARIAARFAGDGILGEEYGEMAGSSGRRWIIDPIDGTRAYICGLPCWGTLIALEEDGRLVTGLIDQPYIGDRFLGDGERAWLNGRPIRVSACQALAGARLSTTAMHFLPPADQARFQRLETAARVTRYGYDCYAYGVLAAGHLDLIAEKGLKLYDYAALLPVIDGAGGCVSNWSGGQVGVDGELLAAATPALRDAAIAALSRK